MAFLSDRGTTISPENGEFHIIKPNAGSPTGYDSFRISEENLFKEINEDISDVDFKVDSNASRILAIEQRYAYTEFIDEVNPFVFGQFVPYLINKITTKGSSPTDVLLIGTTAGAKDIARIEFSSEYSLRYTLRKEISQSVTGSLIYFTPIGTVSVGISFEIETI